MQMPELDTILRQMHDLACEEYQGEKRVAHIRVTQYAIPGSIASLQMTEERARQLGLTYCADRPPLEMLMHPDDWDSIRRSIPVGAFMPYSNYDKDRIAGIPVTIDR